MWLICKTSRRQRRFKVDRWRRRWGKLWIKGTRLPREWQKVKNGVRTQDSLQKVPLPYSPPPRENYRRKRGVSRDNSPGSIPVFLFAYVFLCSKFAQPGKPIYYTRREFQRRKSRVLENNVKTPVHNFLLFNSACLSSAHEILIPICPCQYVDKLLLGPTSQVITSEVTTIVP